MKQPSKKLLVTLSLSQLHQLDAMIADGYADNRSAVLRRLLHDYQKEREK